MTPLCCLYNIYNLQSTLNNIHKTFVFSDVVRECMFVKFQLEISSFILYLIWYENEWGRLCTMLMLMFTLAFYALVLLRAWAWLSLSLYLLTHFIFCLNVKLNLESVPNSQRLSCLCTAAAKQAQEKFHWANMNNIKCRMFYLFSLKFHFIWDVVCWVNWGIFFGS